ncbi:porin family protein [Cochleicola gelatinilyticus]|uniref:Outer membrane protein beta-barrel domain-containing protein n=1 Tax=Cochleicola gelatinilyticus TaxID=1763537 RepID=A0A167KBD7_9FLAO|nr:porin family protein [Cochleicola gelatinilyticus]OAB81688.1 hypothetical protein ULVI_00930 [Cochleicola gelatinilyticus]
MTKKISLIGILLISMISVGQNEATDYGFKGGLNYSSLIDNNSNGLQPDYSGKIGFYIGAFLSLDLNEKFTLRPELLFSQQGSNFNIDFSDLNIFDPDDPRFIASTDGSINESIILLPVLLQFGVAEKLGLGFGPQFGYVLSRKIDYDTNPINTQFIQNDDSEKIELGISLDAEYLLNDNFGLNLRYNYGILERQNFNSSVLQLGVNYKL